MSGRRRVENFVCEHLENISGEALEKYQAIIRQYLRRRQGVYALYRREKLYYVGLARNLRSRLKHHLKDRHRGAWDRFSVYLTVGHTHLRELEALILRIVKPAGNKQIGRFAPSTDLLPRFRKATLRCQREEFLTLIGRNFPAKAEAESHQRWPIEEPAPDGAI